MASSSTRQSSWGWWILIATIAIAPWLNGGGDALSQWILLVGGFLIAAALLLQRARVVDRSTLPYPALIIVATIGLGLFQLLPIWSTAPDAVRPAIVDLHVEMMSTANQDQTMEFEKAPRMLKSGQADLPSRVPWTIDPHATKQTLAMLFLAGAVFLAAFGFTRTTKQLTQLTLTLGWIGVALTIFAVFVKATWNGKLYWVIPVGFAKNVFGPIVYHNLAGNLLGMTLAAAFYQVLIHSRQQGICTSVAQLRLRRWQWPDVATQVRWTVLAVNVAGLLLTLSRGALLSAIAAIVVALVWMRPRKGWAGITIPLGVALVSALALIGWFRASDAISDRYETLMQSERLMEDVRLQHWQDGIRAGKAYGTTGVGLGAYRHIHLLFQDHEIERVFLRAHQQYLETWVDSGLIGLFLLLAVIAGTTISLFWLSRRRERELRAAATLGIVLLVGQLAHACLDFCLYLPASAIMFAGLLGAIFGIAAEAASDRGANRWWLGLPLVMPMRWAAPIVIVAGCGWSAWAGATWAREEAALYDANWNDSQFDTPVKDIQRWIGQLEEFAPGTDDWRIPLALGELYVTDYRHAVLRELNKELTPEQKEALSQQELWDFTDPMVLNARANLMAHEDNFAGIDEEMRTQPLIVERLALAHEQYRWCRKNCPLIAQAHLRLAELMFLRKTPDYDDYRDLEHAAVLAVGNPDVQYEVGRRFANAGQDERALIAWRESLRLSNRRWFAIYDLVGNQLTPKQILEQLLPPNDPQLLLSIAGRFLTEQEQAASRKLYLDRAAQILGNKPPASRDQRSAWHLNRAELCLLRDDRKQAIDEIAAAVRLKPDDHALRAQLAQQLALEERWTEALQEARYCLNLQPNNWDYKNLYANIEQGPKGEAEKHE